MKKYKVEFSYHGGVVTLDLRRVVAVTKPSKGTFLIYFESVIWVVNESEFETVYNAWMNI